MDKERFGYDATGNMLSNREYDFTYGTANRLLTYDRLKCVCNAPVKY
jgi:hypothetical protein